MERTVRNLGGAAYLGVRAMKREGELYDMAHQDPDGSWRTFIVPIPFPITHYFSVTDKERLELGKRGEQWRKYISVHNGDQAWVLDPSKFKSARKRFVKERRKSDRESYKRQVRWDIENLLRTTWKEPGVRVWLDSDRGDADEFNQPVDVLVFEEEGKRYPRVELTIGQWEGVPLKRILEDEVTADSGPEDEGEDEEKEEQQKAQEKTEEKTEAAPDSAEKREPESEFEDRPSDCRIGKKKPGEIQRYEEIYGRYKTIEGVKTFRLLIQKVDGCQTSHWNFDSAEFNPALEEGFFTLESLEKIQQTYVKEIDQDQEKRKKKERKKREKEYEEPSPKPPQPPQPNGNLLPSASIDWPRLFRPPWEEERR